MRVYRFSELFLVVAFALFSTVSYAQGDPRMVVEITADEQGNMPAVQDAIQQALPVLWDRLVEPAARSTLSDKVRATPFVLRVVPQNDRIQVIFNQDRVWQYLDQQKIAYLKESPRFDLKIRMINSNGGDMPKTEEALQAYAGERAARYGMVLTTDAPSVILNWRWLDRASLYLSIEGDSALSGFSETKSLESGEALEQLQAWIDSLLVNMRNSALTKTKETSEPPAVEPVKNELELLITIEQSSTLPAQVVLEDALRHETAVKAVIPLLLSADRRQYRVLLNAPDDRWVATWFRRRGMQAESTPAGWLVH